MTTHRRNLEKELGYRLPEPAWQQLVDHGWEQDLDTGGVSYEVVADWVRRLRAPLDRPRRRDAVGAGAGFGSEQLQERSAVLGALTAIAAEDDSNVKTFRRRRLRGGLIGATDIGAWVADVDRDHRPDGWPITAIASTDPETSTQAMGQALRGQHRYVWFEWAELSADDEWAHGRWPVPPGSPLGELAQLADGLAEKWRWDPVEAAVWSLTGTEPYVSPIRGSANIRDNMHYLLGHHDVLSRVNIEVDLAVTPAQLEAWWRDVRKSFLTRRYRATQLRQLRLVGFIARFMDEGDSWEVTRAKWNRYIRDDHPTWQYDDRRTFRRDAVATHRRVVNIGVRYAHPPESSEAPPLGSRRDVRAKGRLVVPHVLPVCR